MTKEQSTLDEPESNKQPPVKDELPPVKDELTWDEFTQNTTFHGIKYIFDSGQKLRRVVWLMAVIVAVTLFIVQVGQRVAAYFEYKTNVDVDVKFDKEVEFPAVTVCNENNYRTTAAAEWSLFRLIDELFSAPDINAVDISKYNVSTLDTLEFVTSSAHQKKDIIDRCTWRGKPCNIENDFETIITNLGVCYTFNFKRPALSQTEPGSSSALSLLLNVEQYEYMRGPEIIAGIKIHLHDQGEVPLMREQGFSVAPGSYTRAAIKRVQVRNQPYPYGDCLTDSTPVSDCQLRCRTGEVERECGCRDVYMRNTTQDQGHVSTCNLEKKFKCVPKVLDNLSLEHSTCRCSVPCKRVRYEPRLSYAQLSRINIERFVMKDDQKRRHLEKKFHKALEATQRNVQEIVASDKTQIEGLVIATNQLEATLNQTHTSMQDFAVLAQKSQAVNLITTDILKKDMEELSVFVREKSSVRPSDIFPIWTKIMREARRMMWEMMAFQNEGTISKTMEFLLFCLYGVPLTPRAVNVADKNPYPLVNVSALPWVDITDQNDCDNLWQNYKQAYQNLNGDPRKNIQGLSNTLTYFENSTYEYSEAERGCLELVEYTLNVTKTYEKTLNLAKNVVTSNSISEALQFAEKIVSLYETFLEPNPTWFKGVDGRLKEECQWTTEMHNAEGPKAEADRQEIHDVYLLAKDTKTKYDTITTTYNKISLEITSNIIPKINLANDYLFGYNTTKLEVASVFDTMNVEETLKKLEDCSNDMNDFINDYVNSMTIGKERLQHAYSNFTKLKVPYLNTYTVHRLQMVNISAKINDTKIQRIVDNLKLDLEFNLLALINETYDRLSSPIREMKNSITQPVEELTRKLKEMKADMQKYRVSALLDPQFFLENVIQVDIFYEELSYEEIKQNIAFEFLSLLGEIGGFLGLLLGASVLTVCELVDFITLTTLKKFQIKNAVKSCDN